MSSLLSARVLAALCLLLLGANLYFFLMRDWESSYRPESYATLYYPLDAPTLRGWVVEKNQSLRLDLAWNRTPEQWQLLVDGKLKDTLPGADPRLAVAGPIFDGSTDAPLDSFKHRYTLRPRPEGFGPDLNFAVNVIAAAFYKKNGMTFANDVYLVDTDVPVGRFPRHPVSYWVDDYRYVGAANLAAADRVVREEMGVRDSDDTLTRIGKVMRHLRLKLADSGGVPKDDFRWMDPWLMCQEMISGTGKGWCTQNAQIYVFFANRAGIPTRFVFGANTQDDTIVYNGHSWAESWVKEQNRWSYVDMTQSLFGVADQHGALLNTADILHLCQHDTFEGTTARIFKDWHWKNLPVEAAPLTPVTVPFTMVNAMAKEQYNRQAILKFRHPPNVEDIRGLYSMLLKDRTFAWTNFRRYLWDPPAAYSLIPTDAPRTYRIRQSLFAALVIALGLLVTAIFRRA
ncbi:MAG: hypothetical protein JWM88_679 [Verrucomicrobia bacterium]|nr:hypothetical protein [Verrucomicrobiota bacterium]